MDETVTKLVNELAESVRKHTKGLHPDVNEAMKSVQDYVTEATASKTVVEDKLKLLGDKLSDKKLMKKPCKDVIEKIRVAMRVQRKTVKKETHPTDKKRDENPPKTTNLEDKRAESTTTAETAKVSGSVEQKMQEDIRRLKTENQFLKENIDGLYKDIIDGDETSLYKLKPPLEIKDNQKVNLYDGKIKDLANKFHETKTHVSRLETENQNLSRLKTENENLRDTLDRLHKSAQNKSRKPQDTKDYQAGKAWEEENINEVARLTKSEAEYMACLLKELNTYSGCNDKFDTAISLTEPPLQKPLDDSNDGKKAATGNKDAKKQNDENIRARHNEQLQNYFASASSVLEKLMEAEYMACLLKELNTYSGCDGKLDTAISLTEPPLKKPSDSSNDGKKAATGNKDAKKQNDENVRARHNEQLQKNFASAYSVLEKLIELDNVYGRISQISTTFSENKGASVTQSPPKIDLSTATGRKPRSIPFQSTDQSQQALQFEKDVELITSKFNYLKEKKREANYAAGLLQELNKYAVYDGKYDTPITLTDPPIQTARASSRDDKTDPKKQNEENPRSRHNEQLQKNFRSAFSVLERLRLRFDLVKKEELVDNLTGNLKRIEHENAKLRIETDELRTRLSEHAGLLITHGNPAITDLSDPNRPTKLSEKYSEIYDNQWTDAFENISKSQPKSSERDLAGHLYNMLVDCYRFCEEARRKQKLALEDNLFNPPGSIQPSQKRENEDINKLLDKSLSDAVKRSGSVTGANVAQAFVKSDEIVKKYGKLIKLCDKYLQECVQLCWLMQVQTPPLRIDLKTLPGQPFDKNCYREYTKIGEKVAFVVWPALFLHENGPTLYKGIAQGQ